MPRIETLIARPDPNRSAYLARLEKARCEAQDAKIIDANAGRLNREAMDVLEYQGLPWRGGTRQAESLRHVPKQNLPFLFRNALP